MTTEELATWLDGRIGHFTRHLDTPEAVATNRSYWMAVASDLQARMNTGEESR